eukprot:1239506-Amphidinium_carterae.2
MPTMPVPLPDGTWSRARLTTTEASSWLVMVLRASRADYSCIGTHSMKSTLLSWCAKAGMSEGSRRLLCRHVQPKDRTTVGTRLRGPYSSWVRA